MVFITELRIEHSLQSSFVRFLCDLKVGQALYPRLIPSVQLIKKLFVAFLGINQFHRVGLRFVCWFYDRNTQRLTESGFMEKPGIEPATPGLQSIALIHYTTAANFSLNYRKRFESCLFLEYYITWDS